MKKMKKYFQRKESKPEIPESARIDVDAPPKSHRYRCVVCGIKYGLWGKDEVLLYKIVKPESEIETLPPKETVCPICLKIGKITVELNRIEEDLDQRAYLDSIKGFYDPASAEVVELKARARGLKEELIRLKNHLPGGL